jgi:hypothetical protein
LVRRKLLLIHWLRDAHNEVREERRSDSPTQ